MKNRLIFVISGLGLLAALAGAYLMNRTSKPQSPLFAPTANPYADGIFANGIVESAQTNGSNINIYPEVAGTVAKVVVTEGDTVTAGQTLMVLDDTAQRLVVEQQKSQAEATLAALEELKAQPRKETLAASKAQLDLAAANERTAQDQFDKQKASFDIEPRSVSRDVLDNARNALKTAQASREVAKRQYELVRAGAWSYDIRNLQKQYEALSSSSKAAEVLLGKYTIKAPVDGVVLALNTSSGSYISAQGVYDTYTQANKPAIMMGGKQDYLNVRCYIDEILINRLPSPGVIKAQMSIRGSGLHIPLEFVRIQPYVSPKISLSDQRQERVDLRVLPVIFRFAKTAEMKIYPGQLVDVYVGHN
ncbi:HlyD family secretion protein [Herbaspirillum sp. RV1423]|uniref:HlyD family secretion protein n=1 Tax=Herbaspirillum sp. RV1423 TaxID=1443993 RepID=UPI0004B617BC|nr:biotin/lipoyl-binding protein [Herbaspirillum sp. RV1423]